MVYFVPNNLYVSYSEPRYANKKLFLWYISLQDIPYVINSDHIHTRNLILILLRTGKHSNPLACRTVHLGIEWENRLRHMIHVFVIY